MKLALGEYRDLSDDSASTAVAKNPVAKYGVCSTKVKDNKGRVWDLGKGEHMPHEENVWAVDAWTEIIDQPELMAPDNSLECQKKQPIESWDPVPELTRLAA